MADAVVLDPIDHGILRLLQNDARTTYRDLAAAVGVAPSTCLDRVNRLRSTGVIRGYRVELDPAAIGLPLQAFLAVRTGPHHRPLVDQFVAHVLAQPHTRAVYLVAGGDDYFVHVTARDVEDLQRVAVDALTVRPEVMSVRTNLVFQAWEGGPLLPPA
jgi:DNA-binding Lrp family transcriptional regulator